MCVGSACINKVDKGQEADELSKIFEPYKHATNSLTL